MVGAAMAQQGVKVPREERCCSLRRALCWGCVPRSPGLGAFNEEISTAEALWCGKAQEFKV